MFRPTPAYRSSLVDRPPLANTWAMGQRPKPSPSEPAYAHKHTHSPPSIVHVRGEREATDFSRRSAGAAAGFPPLRRPLRRREGGETSDPRVRCVNSLFCLIVVSAMGVAAAATCFVPQLSPWRCSPPVWRRRARGWWWLAGRGSAACPTCSWWWRLTVRSPLPKDFWSLVPSPSNKSLLDVDLLGNGRRVCPADLRIERCLGLPLRWWQRRMEK